ncbi:MAG: hypothetical protein BRD23_05805 [Halobacteriales archaeon SW_9_67_25]|nr:MAG: hypothetical protein BRD23_05805 [Halobacteriales archaeon SW_9_67_25]
MELTQSLVESTAAEYERREPLYAVEQEQVDIFPATIRDGDYGWRDVEWVVQWYYRRYLGAYPDAERRDGEAAFRDNSFEGVLDRLAATVEADDTAERLRHLTALDGVDVPVGSAFLLFLFPDRYVVVGDREWGVLREAGELSEPYPDSPSIEAYVAYDGVCQGLLEQFDVDAWTLYRALWRLGTA